MSALCDPRPPGPLNHPGDGSGTCSMFLSSLDLEGICLFFLSLPSPRPMLNLP